MKHTPSTLACTLLAASCISVRSAPPLQPGELTWEVLQVQELEGASLRGLSVPGKATVWISGAGGVCVVSEDNGRTWRDVSPPQAVADDLDLRSIHALDRTHAWVASAGPGAASRILRTRDGGETWETVRTNAEEDGFYDSIAFWDLKRGIVMGDAVDGYLTILITSDGGDSWARVPQERLPKPLAGECGFAASNRTIALFPPCNAWIGTGGSVARVWRTQDVGHSWTAAQTPMIQGDEAAGIFALAFAEMGLGVAVGGKYTDPGGTANNCATTIDGGESWIRSGAGLRGYRSAVCPLPSHAGAWIAVGITGTDVSLNNAQSWSPIGGHADLELNAVDTSPQGQTIWAVGPNGRVLRMSMR